MPSVFLTFFLLLAFWFPAQAQVNLPATSDRPIYTVVDEPPQFPGGMSELADYLKKNLRYPKAARKARREGRVVVNFIVTQEGRIEDVKHYNSLGLGTDQEAVRLIARMPDWVPGRKDGQAVNVRYNIPVDFSLQ